MGRVGGGGQARPDAARGPATAERAGRKAEYLDNATVEVCLLCLRETSDRRAMAVGGLELASEARTGRKAVSGASVFLDRLDKRFGEVVAVSDLTLPIEPGEFITFLGPSGSGKTTTLMMIAGFEFPTGGEIYIDSHPIVRTPPYRRNIGMVFQ